MDRATPIWKSMTAVWQRRITGIAAVAVAAISVHLLLRFAFRTKAAAYDVPLLVALAIGGTPLVYESFKKLLRREFGSDCWEGFPS